MTRKTSSKRDVNIGVDLRGGDEVRECVDPQELEVTDFVSSVSSASTANLFFSSPATEA